MEFRVYRQWQELSPAVGAGAEALLEEAFPAEERRDMEEVRQLLGKTSLELLTLEEEDRVQGLGLLRAQSLKGDIRVRWYGFRVSTSIFSFIHIGVPRRDKGGFARFGVDELILLDFSSLLQLGRSGCRNR